MKHFQYSFTFLFVVWLASASGAAETAAESKVATQMPKDEIRVETVASQASWVIGNDEVEFRYLWAHWSLRVEFGPEFEQ